jgi:Fic family protein
MKFDRTRPYNNLPPLPPPIDLESKVVLKKCIVAHRALASLRSAGNLIPNQDILINSLPLREAQDSSEIENIVTTGDKLFKAAILPPGARIDPQTKEVLRYRTALRRGYELVKLQSLSPALLRQVCEVLLDHEVQFRHHNADTKLGNREKGVVVYTPPEGGDVLLEKLNDLGNYIQDRKSALDPLVRLALIHYQFEAVHPFEDGNGRTGRILNMLYLIEQGLLDLPVLYLSHYIIEHKKDYYRLLRDVTEKQEWEPWVLFMLSAIEETSIKTHNRVLAIRQLLEDTITMSRTNLPKQIYSKELIELIFVQPYCKIQYVVEAKIARRQTASEYLQALEEMGVLKSEQSGREKLFSHPALLKILKEP